MNTTLSSAAAAGEGGAAGSTRKKRRSKWEEVRAALTPTIYDRIKDEIKKTYYWHSERKFFGMLLDTFLSSLLSLTPEQRTLCYTMLMEDPAGFSESMGEVLRRKVQATLAAAGGK